MEGGERQRGREGERENPELAGLPRGFRVRGARWGVRGFRVRGEGFQREACSTWDNVARPSEQGPHVEVAVAVCYIPRVPLLLAAVFVSVLHTMRSFDIMSQVSFCPNE